MIFYFCVSMCLLSVSYVYDGDGVMD